MNQYRKFGMKMVSLLLAAAMLFTMQGVSVRGEEKNGQKNLNEIFDIDEYEESISDSISISEILEECEEIRFVKSYTKLKTGQRVSYIASYENRRAAITENGDLYCWGRAQWCETENGTYQENLLSPVKVLRNVSLVFI